jgi:hypothetical protein
VSEDCSVRACPLKPSADRHQRYGGGTSSILGADQRAQGDHACRTTIAWLSRLAYIQDNLGLLARRVRDLEDALQSAHSLNSDSEHPLLEESLMHLKVPFLSAEDMSRSGKSRSSTPEDPRATVGSLSVTQRGRVKYIGPGSLLDVSP